MRIITVQFDYPGRDYYKRLMTAFRNSIRVHEPDSNLVEILLDPPMNLLASARKRSFVSNTVKLEAWINELEKSDEETLLVDCDMLMTNPVSGVWEQEFDIAYTFREEGGCSKLPVYEIRDGRKVRVRAKPHPGLSFASKVKKRGSPVTLMPDFTYKKAGRRWPPYNGGVLFVRPNERSLEFFKIMLDINNQMLADKTMHDPYRRAYAGINQAAFGYMMENHNGLCGMLQLNCSTWNACDNTWLDYGDHVKMIHIKSALRRYCLRDRPIPDEYLFLVEMWEKYEKMGG